MTVSSSQRVSRFVTLLLLCSAVFSTLYLSVAEAAPFQWTDCYYFSDASYTEVVGEDHFTCFGNFSRHGTHTEYRLCDSGSCGWTPEPPF